jgi:import inner membrane translocase subunit TIM50
MIWGSFAIFCFHYYLLKNTKKPEKNMLANDLFLNQAKRFDWHVQQFFLLMTRPPVEKLLMDRPPAPPGMGYPKTLILNLRGTIVHSKYKMGEGFEYIKRPGLSVFLQRLS